MKNETTLVSIQLRCNINEAMFHSSMSAEIYYESAKQQLNPGQHKIY